MPTGPAPLPVLAPEGTHTTLFAPRVAHDPPPARGVPPPPGLPLAFPDAAPAPPPPTDAADAVHAPAATSLSGVMCTLRDPSGDMRRRWAEEDMPRREDREHVDDDDDDEEAPSPAHAPPDA